MITMQKRLWSILNNGIELTFGIGLVVAMTRLYTAEQTGAWFLFIAVFGLAGGLRDALIQSALVKSVSGGDPATINGALKANLSVMFVFEIISGTVIMTASLFLHDDLGLLLLLYPAYALPNAWFRWQIYYLRSLLQVREIFMVNVINLAIVFTGMLALFYFSASIQFVPIILGMASFGAGIFAARKVPYRSIMRSDTVAGTFLIIRKYGSFAMMREACSGVSSRISLFYSGALLTLQQTALLGVSQRFAQITLLPNNAFQSLLFPSLMKLVNEGDVVAAKKLFQSSIAQLLAMTIPFALIGSLLSPFILAALNGEEYRSAWGVLVIYVMLSTLITPFGAAFGSMITVLGKPNIAFMVVLVNSILNTVIGYVLMKSIGLLGAPLALAATEIMGFFWIGRILWNLAGISFLATFREIPGVYVSAFGKLILFVHNLRSNEPLAKKI